MQKQLAEVLGQIMAIEEIMVEFSEQVRFRDPIAAESIASGLQGRMLNMPPLQVESENLTASHLAILEAFKGHVESHNAVLSKVKDALTANPTETKRIPD